MIIDRKMSLITVSILQKWLSLLIAPLVTDVLKRSQRLQNNFKIAEFYYHIWDHHEKHGKYKLAYYWLCSLLNR